MRVWWPSGRTVLLAKTKDLTDKKNHYLITCLNLSYKFLTGLVGKYMREQTLENKIQDEGQLEAVVGLLGTVDQSVIDRSIMEEEEAYHWNLVVVFYDYKQKW